jgi:hypothetical protein
MRQGFQLGFRHAYAGKLYTSLTKDGHVSFSECECNGAFRGTARALRPSPAETNRGRFQFYLVLALLMGLTLMVACGGSQQESAKQAENKPAEPAIPADVQAGAEALLGSEAQVLLYGDLAKNGKEQLLAANVVPKTPKESIPGTIVTRAVIAEKDGDKWTELLRCDEHLKNARGYLGLTPIEPVAGWRVQYEQDPEKGLALYLTPVKGMEDRHVLPIGVRWNPATKRYQSLDRSYEHFLLEAPTLGNTRSYLR